MHLQDVYWSGEGQLSVEAVSLVAACLGLALVGFSPLRVPDIGTAERLLRVSATGILVIDACLALVCILKGKYRTGLFGLFLPPVGLIGAVRLARPNSIWARRRCGYGGSTVSGTLMRNFTPCRSGIASTVPWCVSAILRTIARPRPEPGSARAFADR